MMKTQRTLLNARALVTAKTDDVSSASIRSFSCWGREYVKTAEVIDHDLFVTPWNQMRSMCATETQIRTTYTLPRIQSSLGQLEIIDNDLFSRNLLPTKKEPQSGKAEKGEERTRSKIAAVRILPQMARLHRRSHTLLGPSTSQSRLKKRETQL